MNSNLEAEKIYLKYPVVVEGKYDKIKLSSFIASAVIPTDGFGIFNNKEKLALLKKLASSGGLILLTDSDKAGFFIRNRIKALLGEGVNLINLYIPQISGKERRKQFAGKEGLIGVEGIEQDLLYNLFEDFRVEKVVKEDKRLITKTNFYEDGLSGGDGAVEKRNALAKAYSLPKGMSANLLIEAINLISNFDEYKLVIKEMESGKK